ncbi:hypothetical protein SPHINGOAX6_20320 [Sphingomonas sp. AX6]|nr:hypothetical protein SPHINGOAX6_20320 [Sphingomonas sp. AX6]
MPDAAQLHRKSIVIVVWPYPRGSVAAMVAAIPLFSGCVDDRMGQADAVEQGFDLGDLVSGALGSDRPVAMRVRVDRQRADRTERKSPASLGAAAAACQCGDQHVLKLAGGHERICAYR